MRIRSGRTCVAFVIGALAVTAAPASAETIVSSSPVFGTVDHPCTGELVALEGTMHSTATANASGDDIKYHIESNLQGVSGVGVVSGARYVMQDQVTEVNHADATDAQFTSKTTSNFLRQREVSGVNAFLGAGDDFQLHMLAHLTVTNGVTKAEKFELRADCR